MIGRQARHYHSGTVVSSWESEILSTMDLGQARCEYKRSPACELGVPSSRAEMLIRTIAETKFNMVNYGKSHGLVKLGMRHVDMNI